MPNKNKEKWREEPEYKIRAEVSKMLPFLCMKDKPSPLDKNWKRKFKDKTLKLFIDCYENNIYPLPDDLLLLSSLLLGKKKRKGIELSWPLEKYMVLNFLAENHSIPVEGSDLEKGIISFAAKCLDEAGGLNARDANYPTSSGRHDYRKTVREWFSEKRFIDLWDEKRRNFLLRPAKPYLKEIENIVKKIVGKPE